MEGVKGRPNKSNSRPARGLVFGPTKDEISLSESGKRLRVERGDAGRPGGIFKDTLEANTKSKPLQLCDEEVENPMENTGSEIEKQMVVAQMEVQGEEEVVSLA